MMVILAYVAIFCLLLTHSFPFLSAAQFYESVFQEVDFQDRIITNDVLKVVTNVFTVIQCSIYCLNDVTCMSFFYNKITLTCQLHATVFTDHSEVSTVPGYTYYTLSDYDFKVRTCYQNPGFTLYEREDGRAHLCLTHSFSVSLTAQNARGHCQQSGARLIDLESEEKFRLFQDVLFTYLNYGSVWTGGTLDNDQWLWNWNTSNPVKFFNWAVTKDAKQPDHDGNCLRLSIHANYAMADSPCSDEKLFVCEIVIM